MFHLYFSILSVEIFIGTDVFMQVYTLFISKSFCNFGENCHILNNCQYFITFRDNSFIKYILFASNKFVPYVVLGVCLFKL